MPLKADQIEALFPHPILTPIVGEPTHEGIRLLEKQINKNLAAIPSNLGCGTKGFLWISTSATVYATISSVTFTPPANPGSTPSTTALTAAGSAKDIAAVHANHDLNVKLYEEYMAADRLSVKLITNAVEDIFTASLANEYTGYAGVTTKELFKHLNDEYSDIDDAQLSANLVTIGAPYDPNTPIETLWTQISDAVAFAEAGSSKFSPEQILNAAVTAVSASGVFIDDVKDWRKQAAIDKTYAKFKPFFSKAHREWRKTLRATAGGHFPRANSAPERFHYPSNSPTASTELSESIANLATATAADRATVATLTDTVAKLSAELASAQAKLISVLLENQKLLKLVSGRGSRTSGGESKTSGGEAQGPWSGPTIHYCHTHGLQCPHPSFKCPEPATGHIKNATKKDTMGGKTTIYKAK